MADDFSLESVPSTPAAGVSDEDCIIGGVEEAKEMSVLVPPCKRVKFFIKDVKNYALDKDGAPRDWKFFSMELYIDEGIKVDDKVLYKNKVMWQNIPYFANPDKYDFVGNQYFSNYTYLVPLKQLAKALDIDPKNLTAKNVMDAAINSYVYADIVQQAETVKVQNPETGKMERTKTGDFLNEVKNFVKYDTNQLS